MANTIELTPINVNSPVVSYSSRYNYQAIYRDSAGRTFLQSWKPRVFSSDSKTKTMIVSKSLAFRPDLVSDTVYGTPLLWWAICSANNILNPLDRTDGLYPGRLIMLPDSSVIYGMGS